MPREEKGGGKGSRKRRNSEVSDEEFDEEGEFDDGGRRGERRAKRKSVENFIEVEAAVDTDEDDTDIEEGDEEGFIDKRDDIPDEEEDASRRMRRRLPLPGDDETLDPEALERELNERYGSYSNTDRDTEFYEETTDIDQQSLLPSIQDPKLWMVTCAIGHEREVAVSLMQKCIKKGSNLLIRSAIAVDNLENYIYIEADKECHVREACKDMRNIYTSSKIILVPIKEMATVLSVKSKTPRVSRDMWVRMKIAAYKGDLARVVDVDNVKQRVTVKLVPRIDLQALANKVEGREVPKKSMINLQKLMQIDEARDLDIPVEERRNRNSGDYFDIINGMMFKDGYLYKTVSMKSISTANIQPSYDELEKFNSENEYVGKSKRGSFMKGDRIIVTKGELINLKGRIEKVDDDIIYINPDAKGLPKTLAVREREICKYFEPGNHVKVVSGLKEGSTGMVVSVQGQSLNIITDTAKEVLRVFSNDVVESMVVGGSHAKTDTKCYNMPRIRQPPVKFSRGGPPKYFGGFGTRDKSLIGTCIKILVGNFKGHKGQVIDVKGNLVRVELQSPLTIITVDRNTISDNVNPYISYRDVGSETPMHPSRTPMHPTYV